MPFNSILKDLTERTKARGAIMVDWEGEVVAMASADPELDMALVGAHHGVVLGVVKEAEGRGEEHVRNVIIATSGAKVAVVALKEGYCLVVVSGTDGSMGKVLFEMEKASRMLEQEMG